MRTVNKSMPHLRGILQNRWLFLALLFIFLMVIPNVAL